MGSAICRSLRRGRYYNASMPVSFSSCRLSISRAAIAALLGILASSVSLRADDVDRAGVALFESRVRPLLVRHCYACHSARAKPLRGGLRLDHAAGWRRGGKSGPAIVPGDADQSALIRAVRYRGAERKMPPAGKLSPGEIAALVEWVERGAPDPRIEGPAVVTTPPPPEAEQARQFWSFQTVTPVAVPSPVGEWKPRVPLDRFIGQRIVDAGLQPARRASETVLLRRASFDLTGLPPTPPQLQEFIADGSPDAFARVVDRLLASPGYGERWGSRWLDVVRYADSNGLDENRAYVNAFRYRDYVIAAWNQDKPFDQFVREQLAGDLLPLPPAGHADATAAQVWRVAVQSERTVATGFLALGPKGLREVDGTKMELDIIDDQVTVVGSALMGLTLQCARCHDHKFDPLPTADYYALAGIFKSTRTMERIVDARGKGNGFWLEQEVALDAAAAVTYRQLKRLHDARMAPIERALPAQVLEILRVEAAQRSPPQKQALAAFQEADSAQTQRVEQWIALAAAAPTPVPSGRAMSVTEGKAQNVQVHLRGSPLQLGEEVPRGVPRVLRGATPLTIPPGASGRLELARWLTDPRHPLTARVIVNRLWQGHFGAGLVRTPDNFGWLGDRPTHPRLLDWLAGRLIAGGWSLKRAHRSMMLSATYQMSTLTDPVGERIDPQNRLRWRFRRRRLDAEEVRDALLFVGGNLERQMGGSLLELEPRQYVNDAKTGAHLVGYDNRRRSIYQPVIRNKVYELFRVFDFPNPSLVTGRRSSTTVSPQALWLMNSELVLSVARRVADRLSREAGGSATARIDLAYRSLYGRPPTEGEVAAALGYLDRYPAERPDAAASSAGRAWFSLCQALLLANEFLYID